MRPRPVAESAPSRLGIRALDSRSLLAALFAPAIAAIVTWPALAGAQPAQPPPSGGGTQSADERARGTMPAIPQPGAGVQPTPPPSPVITPTPPPGNAPRPGEVPATPGGPSSLKPAGPPPPAMTKDVLPDAGYVPGYRTFPSLGLGPFAPRSASLPGGITPAYNAPMPPSEWTFRWSGYLSATAQYSLNERQDPQSGQSKLVFHAPPQTTDEYQSFVGTSTMPGNWIQMNLRYGNRDVTAQVTLTTWNPSAPITYYQPGSQGFINNAFITYNIPPLGALRLRAMGGYFYNYYGALGQYTPGMYTNTMVGGPRGVGVTLTGEYELTPEWSLIVEEGVVGNRNARSPWGALPSGANSGDPTLPASWVQHLHAGLLYKSDYVFKTNVHWLWNFAHDDRVQYDEAGNRRVDNQITRGIDEAYVRDGSIHVVGADASISHPIYGLIAAGGSYIRADHAFPLRGLITFAGEGQHLGERWLGLDTTGTGSIQAAGINYSGSIGRIVSAPLPFDANGPDLIINAGAVVATSQTDNPLYGGRVRHKYGADALYIFHQFVSAGLRVDRVVPNSKDSDETFHVVAARLVLKTGWQSRENLVLLYAKWFYGPHTHPEYSNLERPWLDDQLIALNINMWW